MPQHLLSLNYHHSLINNTKMGESHPYLTGNNNSKWSTPWTWWAAQGAGRACQWPQPLGVYHWEALQGIVIWLDTASASADLCEGSAVFKNVSYWMELPLGVLYFACAPYDLHFMISNKHLLLFGKKRLNFLTKYGVFIYCCCYYCLFWFWCYEEVGFTLHTRIHAASNCVLCPTLVQIVRHVCIPVSNPVFSYQILLN